MKLEVETTDSSPKLGVTRFNEVPSNVQDERIQCNLPMAIKYSIDLFRHDSEIVNYYTGFKDYNAFMIFTNVLVLVLINLILNVHCLIKKTSYS